MITLDRLPKTPYQRDSLSQALANAVISGKTTAGSLWSLYENMRQAQRSEEDKTLVNIVLYAIRLVQKAGIRIPLPVYGSRSLKNDGESEVQHRYRI